MPYFSFLPIQVHMVPHFTHIEFPILPVDYDYLVMKFCVFGIYKTKFLGSIKKLTPYSTV